MSKKNIAFFILFCQIIVSLSCRQEQKLFNRIEGKTMGTTYHITFDGGNAEQVQNGVDSLLRLINLSMSTYIDSSTISMFNKADSVYCFNQNQDPFFKTVFAKAAEVRSVTDGAFDPSIMPLVNYYGFGYTEKKKVVQVDSAKVAELLSFMLFDSIVFIEDELGNLCLKKPLKGVQLDFSAIAKGYGVDKVGEYIENRGIRNYMVEIGGEVRALGLNEKNTEWIIGINRPSENADPDDIELPLKISNRSVATSGNYRNVYESKGNKFAHIIDPKTGYSRQSDILSATVIARDCMTADAYATAFMVMGIEKSLDLIEQLKDVEACFIYDLEGDGVFEFKISTGFTNYFLHNEQK